MSRLAETESRRPHPLVRQRVCQDILQEQGGDSAESEDIICGIRGESVEGAPAARVMFGELI